MVEEGQSGTNNGGLDGGKGRARVGLVAASTAGSFLPIGATQPNMEVLNLHWQNSWHKPDQHPYPEEWDKQPLLPRHLICLPCRYISMGTDKFHSFNFLSNNRSCIMVINPSTLPTQFQPSKVVLLIFAAHSICA